MKIIAYERGSVSLRPDGALLRDNDSFYTPAFSGDVRCGVGLYVKVTRLAKSLQEKFAERCYDEVSVAIPFYCNDLLAKAYKNRLSTDLSYSFDRSFAVSPVLIDKSEISGKSLKIKASFLEKEYSLDGILERVNELLSECSSYFTLKIGDILYVELDSFEHSISKDDTFRVYIGEDELLNFQVK